MHHLCRIGSASDDLLAPGWQSPGHFTVCDLENRHVIRGKSYRKSSRNERFSIAIWNYRRVFKSIPQYPEYQQHSRTIQKYPKIMGRAEHSNVMQCISIPLMHTNGRFTRTGVYRGELGWPAEDLAARIWQTASWRCPTAWIQWIHWIIHSISHRRWILTYLDILWYLDVSWHWSLKIKHD